MGPDGYYRPSNARTVADHDPRREANRFQRRSRQAAMRVSGHRVAFIIAGALVALTLAITVGWPLIASAVHDDGHFELEGNIADGPAAGPDWESVFSSSGGVDV